MKVSGTSVCFFKNGADIPMTNDEKLFVLVQQHGESSLRETSLMI
jgi:hypothetical protein